MTTVLVSVLSAYMAALAFLAINQRKIIFSPDPSIPVLNSELASLGFRQIRLQGAGGLFLSPWYVEARPGRMTVVYFQGNAGNLGVRVERVLPYVRAGHGVLLVAYRGYGGNPGLPMETGLYEDARTHIRWLSRQGIQDRDIVLFGESLGGAVALQMAIERPPAGLVLEAPFASILASARTRFPMFAFDWLIRDKFANIEKIPALRSPLLLVHGARDRVTPIRFGRQLFEAAPQPKFAMWIEEAGHGDLMEFGMAERVMDFISWVDHRQESHSAQ